MGAASDKGQQGRARWRWLRRAGTVVAALVALPLLLAPVYRFGHPVSTLMVYARLVDGPIQRDWVAFDEIAPALVDAVLMSEDGRFCQHNGVDWQEMGKVLDSGDDSPRGASTITMQTVKNLFLWTSRSYVRKAFEIPLALYANLVWSKRRTVELYLNIAEWGPGIFGAEAAAKHFFNKSAKQLTPAQAALLAVTLPNPEVRNPARPTRRMQQLARIVGARARASGAYVSCVYP